MKSLHYIAIVFFSLTVFASAQAAQDQSQVLANRAHTGAGESSKAEPQNAEIAEPVARRRVLPLDHGPHAQSTPWLNQQIRQHQAEAEQKARAAVR